MIFRSADAGATWTESASPAGSDCVLHALEVHPEDANRIYAGFDCDQDAARAGLYESSDSGKTWSRPSQLNAKGVWSLAFSPRTRRLAAGTTVGVFVNKDHGWERISPESNQELKPVVSLAFDPEDEEILLAGTSHLPWRTVDGGKTWASIHSGMIDDSDVFSISPDASTTGLVYASACSGVYKSTVGGTHWLRLPTPRGAYRAYLVVPDPHRPRVVYAATSSGLLRSVDGGAIWTRILPDIVHAVSFDPVVPKRVFVASTSSGVLLSEDGGDSFQSRNQGFANRRYRAVARLGKTLFVAAASEIDPSLFVSDDEGQTWKTDVAWPRNLRHLSTTERDSKTVVCGSATHVYLSKNRGRTWTTLPAVPGGRVIGLKAIPGGVLAAGAGGVFTWTPAKPRWTTAPTPQPLSVHEFFSTSDDFVLVEAQGTLLTSADSGTTWRVCPGLTGLGEIHSMAGIGGDQGFILAGLSLGLYRSDDGCQSWTPIRDDLTGDTVSLVAIHNSPSLVALAVQYGRVLISIDRGRTWRAFSETGWLGSFPLQVLANEASTRLYALFPGSGVMVQDIIAAGLTANPAEGASPPPAPTRQGAFRK
ncbi:MAG: hypothetical protein ABI693_16340 [Bryobacteraceae bacterium]